MPAITTTQEAETPGVQEQPGHHSKTDAHTDHNVSKIGAVLGTNDNSPAMEALAGSWLVPVD